MRPPGTHAPCRRQRPVRKRKDALGQGRSQPEQGEGIFGGPLSVCRSKPAEKQPGLPWRTTTVPSCSARSNTSWSDCSIGMEKTLTLPSSMVMVLTRSILVYVTASVHGRSPKVVVGIYWTNVPEQVF